MIIGKEKYNKMIVASTINKCHLMKYSIKYRICKFLYSPRSCTQGIRDVFLLHSHFLSMHFISKYSCNDFGQSASVSHGISVCAVMKKDNKIMLLKHDKRLCMNNKSKKKIWKGLEMACQHHELSLQDEIRKEIESFHKQTWEFYS